MATNREKFQELESVLGYRFGNRDFLLEAVTHRSFVNESKGAELRDNQRLEFFGDAVLGLLVSRRLLERFPAMGEGDLSRLRASLVDEPALAAVADKIRLGTFLLLGRGEEKTGGRKKRSILADALEALVAAVYLDGGLAAAEQLVDALFGSSLDRIGIEVIDRDFKTRLQEVCHAVYGKAPYYVLEEVSGPDHERLFEMSVRINDECLGKGFGKSKKGAEQAAARKALEQLGEAEESAR